MGIGDGPNPQYYYLIFKYIFYNKIINIIILTCIIIYN